MFSAVKAHSLVFTTDFWKSDVVLFPGLLVMPAWTLGVELSFLRYRSVHSSQAQGDLCPFDSLGSTRGCLILIGIGLRDPWTYRFFPSELAFFLVGALAHQILLPAYLKHMGKAERWLPEAATAFMVVLSVEYFEIPGMESQSSVSLHCLRRVIAFHIPLLAEESH